MNKPAVGWPDTDHPRTPSGWAWAPNLLPPVAPAAWPRGIQRNASEAESILSEAVAWWDPTVSGFRDGDRWLRNSGTAGGLLDLRLGSSVVANTNDPKWLGPESTGYVYLPGVVGNNLSVSDEAALDITGDLTLTACVAFDDWTPTTTSAIVGKWGSPNQSYYLRLNTAGTLSLLWSTTGSNSVLATSTASVPAADGTIKWVRGVLDVDDGGVYKVYFYTSDDGVLWTQLGSVVTGGSTTSIYSGAAALVVGDLGIPPAARFYRVIVASGVHTSSTTVLDVDCNAITSGSATSFTATTGQTVTINRSTSGRKTVAMPNRWSGGRACFLFGTDDYMECVGNWQHSLLNFGQGDSFTVVAVIRNWHALATIRSVVSKSSSATGNGLSLGFSSNALTVRPTIDDGTNFALGTGPTLVVGATSLVGMVVDRAAKQMTPYLNAIPGAAVSTVSVGAISQPTIPLRIMAYGSGTTFPLDAEFTAAAVFRRALTTAEITTLSTYLGGN